METKNGSGLLNQAIVLPFQGPENVEDAGTGLGLHFLLGNILILNKNLKEMWFGWRVKKIFPQKSDLLAFCRGVGTDLDIRKQAAEQKIRYWVFGKWADRRVVLELTDAAGKGSSWFKETPFDPADHLIGFRNAFMDWTGECGLAFDEEERRASLWPEEITLEGLDAVGRALKASYILSSYDTDAPFDTAPFVKAVDLCSTSFMALDLLGWAHYRRNEYDKARSAFIAALDTNPQGAGAMAGIMWCAVMGGDESEALSWALKKATLCGEDIEATRQKTLRLLEKQKKT